MLDKYFVPSGRALKLKELGFDEECLATIDQTEYLHIKGTKSKPRGSMMYDTIDCPLFCQVFDWFREKYDLYSQTPSICIDDNDRIFYNSPIYDEFDNVVFESMEQYKSYEEAQLACLDKLIEICQKSVS